MRFALKIADDRTPEGWIEKHEFEDAAKVDEAWPLAAAMVDKFNATLHSHELPRRLISIDTAPETEEEREDREMRESSQFSDIPEGCCPACWTRDREEVRMEYSERCDQDVCPECGYT
jgi:hypothetical protein